MNAKNDRSAMKTLAAGLLLGGLALGSLATTGCWRIPKPPASALELKTALEAGDVHTLVEAAASHSKVVRNHNETFLTDEAA
jgi:hypothetical protein